MTLCMYCAIPVENSVFTCCDECWPKYPMGTDPDPEIERQARADLVRPTVTRSMATAAEVRAQVEREIAAHLIATVDCSWCGEQAAEQILASDYPKEPTP